MNNQKDDIINYLFHEGVINTPEMLAFRDNFGVTSFHQSSFSEFSEHGLMKEFFDEAVLKTYSELAERPLEHHEMQAIFGDSELYPLVSRMLWDHMHRAVLVDQTSIFIASPFVDWVAGQSIGRYTTSGDIGGVFAYFLMQLQNEYNMKVAKHNYEEFDNVPFLTAFLIDAEQSIYLKDGCFDVVWSFGSDLRKVREAGLVWEIFPTSPDLA